MQKEGGGGDNLAVGWQLPDGTFERPIPGSRLSPWEVSTNPPALLMEPEDLAVAELQTAWFRISARGGEPLTFQWWRDGTVLLGERTATLLLENLTTNDSGSRFQCVVTNQYGSVTSRVAVLTVFPEMVPPTTLNVTPPPGATVRQLTQVEVLFSERVTGIDAADLLINDQPATNVTGLLAGPFVFQFAAPAAGPVQLEWSADHGITDLAAIPNSFAGGAWTVTVDPSAIPGDLVINEFLAANQNGLLDEDGEAQDWIEILNRGTNRVDLAGWSLTDNADEPGQWIFPARPLEPGEYLVVFASGKDRKPNASGTLHTNFKLGANGEYLGLFSPESPRVAISELAPKYPEQRNDYSYGRDSQGAWRYFNSPTPGGPNGASTIASVVAPVHFSVPRGFFDTPFNVHLSTETSGAFIRYTLDGSEPTEQNGLAYANALRIAATTLLRAAAFKPNCLPSTIGTHTYFYGLSSAQLSLPVLSIVTSSNNLFGPTGILGINGGTYDSGAWEAVNPGDYYNPSQRGLAWERPVSA